jgi:DNA polymerase-3 subunit chi
MENNIDILISLSEEPIVDFTSYPRIAEIVGFEEKEKESGRARFRYYKNHGIRLNTHHIKL